jgi:hypothetical protein
MTHIMSSWRPLAGWFLLMLSLCSPAFGDEITLGWDPEPSVAGYIVYCGTSSGDYNVAFNIGTNTSQSLDGLQPGQTYYFAIMSYDTNGISSALSGEISYLVPGILKLTPAENLAGAMILSFPESPGDYYEVQSSFDLKSWTTFWTTDPAVNNDWVEILLFDPGNTPQEFFRLIMH